MENRKLFASEWHDVAGLVDDFRKQSAEALFCFIRNATTEEKEAYKAFCSGLDTLELTAYAFELMFEQEAQ